MFATVFVLWKCTQPLDFNDFTYDRVLVVDGVVTDQLAHHTVRLSYSLPLVGQAEASVTDALVWVKDDQDNCFDYEEIEPGLYESILAFQAEVGSTYQLFISTEDGNEFRSEPESFLQAPPIDSIYDRYLETAPTGATEVGPGIQLFLDTQDKSGATKYYRYDWEEHYKIETPLRSNYIYLEELDSIVAREFPIHICYSGGVSAGINIGTSVGAADNSLLELPIRFLPSGSDQIQKRYAINVSQYAIDEDAYNFYRNFKEITEGGGSLFDSQTGLLVGNVSSESGQDEIVLGYFEVSGVTSRRVFFDLEDFDRFQEVRARPVTECLTSNWIEPDEDEKDFFLDRVGTIYLIIEIDSLKVVPRACASCLDRGVTQEPDFWID